MSTIAVTGSASGIGAAVCKRLEDAGHRLIRVDRASADIEADLSTAEGRRLAVEQTLAACEGRLDGVVCCAGVGVTVPVNLIVSVNYFGVTEYLEGLKEALARSEQGNAVIIGSVAGSQQVAAPHAMAAAMLDNDENLACRLAGDSREPHTAYAASKYAVTLYGRRTAVEWGRQGLRLNIVAPGAVETPLLQASREDPRFGEAVKSFVAPLGRAGQPDEIGAAVEFLVSDRAGFVNGAVLYIDGGMDAMMRAEQF